MTTITLTTAVILVLCCAYSWRTGECRTFNCLFSRLDSFNCTPPQGHTDWPWPGPNTYALFRTRIGRNSTSSHPYCEYRTPRVKKFSEMIRDIDDLGDQNVKLLYSPGYLLGRRYANSMLVSYNVECPEGRLPFLVYKDFYLRGTVCYGRCEDYVIIGCTTCGTSESCGTKPTDNFYHLGQRQFSVTFRTSRAKNDNGFELSVICFDPGLSNPADKKKRDLEIFRNEWLEEAERSRRQVAIPPQRVLVSLSDVVTYRINTINVFRKGQLIRRIRKIYCLVIEDTSGEGRLFLGDAVELRPDGKRETIQLSGPGELLLLPNNATFIRDSKAFTPPAFEQRVVTDLTNELFNVISLKNDHYIAEDLEEEDIDETNTKESQPQVPSHLGGRRSAEPYEDEPNLSAIQPQVPSHFNHRRSAIGTPSTDCLISTSAISLAILYESSSNPVVSTIATSVLNIATRQSPLCVQSVRNSGTNCEHRTGRLRIYARYGRDLPDTNPWLNDSDPYIEFIAVDSNGNAIRSTTSEKRGTRNPIWNEWIDFGTNTWKTFKMKVYDADVDSDDSLSNQETRWLSRGKHPSLRHNCHMGYVIFDYAFY